MGAHGGVARTEDENVSVQDSSGVDLAICHYVCGPGKCLDRQKRVSSGGGGELGIRGGNEEFCLVQSVEGLSVERGDADAEVGLFKGSIGKDGLNSIRDRAPGGSGMRRCVRRCVSSAMLCNEKGSRNEGQRQMQREESRCTGHGGSLAGRRMRPCLLIE